MSSSYLFEDSASLRIAVQSWISNENDASEIYGDINSWDVSAITDFSFLFNGKTTFNSNISDWDVSNGQYFNHMFSGAESFDQDIGNWDVSKGTYFYFMFSGATIFNQDISDWDVSSATYMTGMFENTHRFNQDISNWDVSSNNYFNFMFSGAEVFEQDLSIWKVDSSFAFEYMFYGADKMLANGWSTTPINSDFNQVTADEIAPTFSSASTNTFGTKVILTYNETLSATTAATSAFAVTTGGASNSVTDATVSGSTVELTLATTLKNDEAVTVAYTDPSVSDDANAIQDSAGNDVATLSSISVTNNSTVSSSSGFSTNRENIKIETSIGTYYIIKEAKTFSDAKTAAESDGGFLASFETENEYNLLYNAIASEYSSDSSWGTNTIGAGNGVYLRIGGTDGNTISRYDSSDSDWNWKWISDSSEISKSRSEWGEGTLGQEPDNYFSEGQDSLAMSLTGWGGPYLNGYGDAGEWNDVRDSSELYYLVEVSSTSSSSDSSTQIKVADVNSSYVADSKGFASISGSAPVTVTSYEIGQETTLSSIKDYDGNLHAGDNLAATASSYKYQGMLDVNGDGVFETIFTNKSSKRWVTAKVDSTTGQIDFDDNGAGGGTRVVGIYEDPLIAEGSNNGGYLSDGVTPAPANFGVSDADRYVVVNGETIDRLALNSQVRFQNDLEIDNLQAKHSGDYDSDGIHEVYWKTADGTAYLRALMHADGNIRYANYQSLNQMVDYLTNNGDSSAISDIL